MRERTDLELAAGWMPIPFGLYGFDVLKGIRIRSSTVVRVTFLKTPRLTC